MRRLTHDSDVIGARVGAPPSDLGPLFAQPADNANLAASTDAGEKLLREAEAVAEDILAVSGRVAMWQVRIELAQRRIIANDGRENLDALGALARRMGLVADGTERPPAWAQKLLPSSHANRHTVWRRRAAA